MFADKSLVTVWSAPNYCYRCGNVASILTFDENMETSVQYFSETEENNNMIAPGCVVRTLPAPRRALRCAAHARYADTAARALLATHSVAVPYFQ